MDSHWTLGVLIGLPIGLVAVLTCGAVAAWLFKFAETYDNYGMTGAGMLAWILSGAATILFAIMAVGFFPYGAQYHRWQVTTGTVQEVGKRLVGDSSGMSQKIVIRYTDGRERGCNDTRCSIVHPGDRLTLLCKRSWQWASTPGWDCNYGEVRRR